MKTEAEIEAMELQAKKPPEARKRISSEEEFLLSHEREHHPADILISDFWPPEMEENKFLLFYAKQL